MSAVLALTFLSIPTVHAQSSWWNQQKTTAPASDQHVSPSPPSPSSASASQQQEIDTSNTKTQHNTTADVKKIPSFSYIEIGRSEIEFTDKPSSTGRYIGVSFDGLFGSYQRPLTNFAITEVGIGSSYRRAPPFQFTGALAWQRWEMGEVDRRLIRLMIGLQAHVSQHFDMWISTGYMWTRKYNVKFNYKGEIIETDFFDTTLAKMGVQIFLTPKLGIVFEADFLHDMKFDFYRTGIRFNF